MGPYTPLTYSTCVLLQPAGKMTPAPSPSRSSLTDRGCQATKASSWMFTFLRNTSSAYRVCALSTGGPLPISTTRAYACATLKTLKRTAARSLRPQYTTFAASSFLPYTKDAGAFSKMVLEPAFGAAQRRGAIIVLESSFILALGLTTCLQRSEHSMLLPHCVSHLWQLT
ncbi:hypothetical protein BKA93DRAFT_474209 [Sparassis latifolia]